MRSHPLSAFESRLLGGSDIGAVEVIAVGPWGSNFGPSAKERHRKQAKRWWVFVIAGSCQAVSAVPLIIFQIQPASRDGHSASSVYLVGQSLLLCGALWHFYRAGFLRAEWLRMSGKRLWYLPRVEEDVDDGL